MQGRGEIGLGSKAVAIAFVVVVGIVALYLISAVLNFLEPLLNQLVMLVVRVVAFGIACICLYQAFHGFRAAITGTNDEGSKPVDNPESLGNRSATAFVALFFLFCGLLGLAFAFGF
jgi:hypothetical protein